MTTLRARPDVIGFVILALTVRLAFWSYTGRIWEDALITLMAPRNAAAGLGLTHHAGEPLTHSFTSALAVLVPLIGEVISAGSGLLTIRLASLSAVAVAIVAADALGRHLGLGRASRALVMGFLALDFNHIFYGMTGMETQIAVAAMIVAFWAAAVRHRLLGIAIGVALLARPDFAIVAVAIGLPLLVRDRPQLSRTLLGAAVVIVPWLLFTTLYYGSPIPQSIAAKSVAFTSFPTDMSLVGWVAWVPMQLIQHVPILVRTFAPFLSDTMASDAPVPTLLPLLVGAAASVLTVVGIWDRRNDPLWWPLILFVLVYSIYRILFLPTVYFDWYLPPFTAASAFLIAAALQRLTRPTPRLAPPVAALILVVVALPLPWHFGIERTIQLEIEDGVRTQAATALGTLVPVGAGVASESAGYVGWFSHVLLWDYPGLTSRRSYDVTRSIPREERGLEALIDRLQPPWVIIRPDELAKLRAAYPATAAGYSEVARFGDARTQIEVAGYRKHTVDSAFIILRREP